jgi:hypothetical protein
MAFFKSVFRDRDQTPPADRGPMWIWFRRLFLGTVIEALLEHGVGVEFATLAIRFEDESRFQVPHIDNYMRFTGVVEATLAGDPPAGAVGRLKATLLEAWPALVAVVDIPVGDRLTADRNDIDVQLDGGRMVVRFDLEAD